MGNLADHKTENQKFDDVVRNILYDFKVEYAHDTDHLTFSNTAEIRKQAADELEQKDKLDFALNERDWEIQEEIILDAKKDLIKTLGGLDGDISNEIIKLSDFNNGVVELEINDYDLKNRFEQATSKLIQENNVDIVSKMLVDDINQSIEELEEEKTEKNNLSSITELIINVNFTKTPKALRRSKGIAEEKQENHMINKYGRK